MADMGTWQSMRSNVSIGMFADGRWEVGRHRSVEQDRHEILKPEKSAGYREEKISSSRAIGFPKETDGMRQSKDERLGGSLS